jgi:hypothetical protein
LILNSLIINFKSYRYVNIFSFLLLYILEFTDIEQKQINLLCIEKGLLRMSDDKRRITKVKVILSTILLAIIAVAVVTGYKYYRENRWIAVQDSPEDWVQVEGQIGEKNSAPCPQMTLRQGKVKFLPDMTGKSERLLGYKLTVAAEMGKSERYVTAYAPYTYQARFSFTLVDKDGFPLQVVEGTRDYEIFEISKLRSYQNVCTTPIGNSTVQRTESVYVSYILSATGPHH